GMSAEDREESRSYLNALWSSYQEAVTRARKLPSDALAQYVGSFAKSVPAAGGDAAQVALRAKLVTGVKSRLETEQRLIELVGRDDTTGSFKSVSDRKSTRLNSSHLGISYAVFCLKKKNETNTICTDT